MRDKIAKILAGEFDYETGSLEFSCPKIELAILPGEQKEGSFFIYGEEGKELTGEILVSGIRMICQRTEFTGNQAEIHYCFDGAGMEAGEVVKGEFKVLSAQGESYLTYVVSVIHKTFQTSLGDIKNLFHFTNLAKTNWEEAVKLFYSPEFIRVFTGNDRQYLNAYKGLATLPEKEQRVEEFLLEIHKKQAVEYFSSKEEIVLSSVLGIWEEIIPLNRNGWGYTSLFVELDGDFITGEKEHLSDDDFLGNICSYKVQIHEDRLHAGRNFGSVRFFNEYTSVKIPVTVNVLPDLKRSRRRGKKQKIFELMRFYMEFRMKRISTQVWFGETLRIVEGMQAADEKSVSARLFHAQLLLTQERFNEARWVLDHVKSRVPSSAENPSVYCYYLYLTTLCKTEPEYVEEVTEEIRRVYGNHSTNWKIAWLLLYLDEECNRSASRKWIFLEQQFGRGCVSPVWYMEAIQLIRENPTLLMKLTDFVVQVLNFAAKYGLMNDDMISQIHYLASRIKAYSDRLFFVLKSCYEIKKDSVSLQAVCTLLIKGNKIGPEYAKWYREGIVRNIRITRLYEYYMMSVDTSAEEEIPKMALLYFAYHSELDYEKNAFLYAYLVKHREEYPELYITYLPDMEKFITEQLEKCRINRDLAYLYKKLLSEQMLTDEGAQCLSEVLFTHRICLEDDRIRRVIVIEGKKNREISCPVVKKSAYIPIFTADHEILLEDKYKNRFTVSVPYVTEKLMIPGRMAGWLEGKATGRTGFFLYLCEGSKNYTVITAENEWCVRLLLDSGEITEAYRQEIVMKLVRFYYETDQGEALDALLKLLKPEALDGKERAEIIRYMVIRGMYGEAVEWVERYGVHGVEPKTLVRLCSRILVREEFQENPLLTQVVYYAFARGKYDENILYYLGKYYRGLTRELRDIWLAAERFDVECYALCERMLVQMLYTGSYIGEEMQVLHRYLEGGARTEVVQAYLSHCAYLYFVKDKLTDEYVFQELKRLRRSREDLNVICELALLKHFAEKKEWDDEEQEMIRHFTDRIMKEQRIYFPFFKKFTSLCPCIHGLSDKTILEYRTNPAERVVLHYMLKQEDGKNSQYHTEELRNMYGGIFIKSFVLFFGESLQYYITEERDGKEKLTQSGTLSKSDTEREMSGSRFGLLNDISAAGVLQDYDTAAGLLYEYLRMDYLTEKLFRLV